LSKKPSRLGSGTPCYDRQARREEETRRRIRAVAGTVETVDTGLDSRLIGERLAVDMPQRHASRRARCDEKSVEWVAGIELQTGSRFYYLRHRIHSSPTVDVAAPRTAVQLQQLATSGIGQNVAGQCGRRFFTASLHLGA